MTGQIGPDSFALLMASAECCQAALMGAKVRSTGAAMPSDALDPLLCMSSRFTAAMLAACGLGFGLVAASYGRYISLSDSPKEAAPFAAPFVLFVVTSSASIVLSVAAVADGDL